MPPRTLACLAVDDEPLALRVLEKYCSRLQSVELRKTFLDPLEALEALRQEPFDLVFLDINMPHLSGLGLLRSLPDPPLVIFTTAYPEYAVQGFELEAVDYLLKPFSFERFVRAVNKVLARRAPQPEPLLPPSLPLKVDRKLYRIPLADILYLEAYGDYVKVHTPAKTYLSKTRLQELEEQLPAEAFLRIHRSFVVALSAIEFLEGQSVVVKGRRLPVARSQREELLRRWK